MPWRSLRTEERRFCKVSHRALAPACGWGCWVVGGLGGGQHGGVSPFVVEDTSAQGLEKVKFNRLLTCREGGKDEEACGPNKSVIYGQ